MWLQAYNTQAEIRQKEMHRSHTACQTAKILTSYAKEAIRVAQSLVSQSHQLRTNFWRLRSHHLIAPLAVSRRKSSSVS